MAERVCRKRIAVVWVAVKGVAVRGVAVEGVALMEMAERVYRKRVALVGTVDSEVLVVKSSWWCCSAASSVQRRWRLNGEIRTLRGFGEGICGKMVAGIGIAFVRMVDSQVSGAEIVLLHRTFRPNFLKTELLAPPSSPSTSKDRCVKKYDCGPRLNAMTLSLWIRVKKGNEGLDFRKLLQRLKERGGGVGRGFFQ